jgi:two-component system chemotaxis response regulator CheB
LWVVGVVASAGELRALRATLSGLPSTFPAALAVVQRFAPRHKSHLAEILARRTAAAQGAGPAGHHR